MILRRLFPGKIPSGGDTQASVRHGGRVDWVVEGGRKRHASSWMLGKLIVNSQTTGRRAWLDCREPEWLAGEVIFPSRDLELFLRK